MAAPTESLGDYRTAGLKRALKSLWDTKGTAMTVDDVAGALLADEDQRIRDVGQQLYPFTTAGEYGRFFNGANTVAFESSFVVLELEELKGRKHAYPVNSQDGGSKVASHVPHPWPHPRRLATPRVDWVLLRRTAIPNALSIAAIRQDRYFGS